MTNDDYITKNTDTQCDCILEVLKAGRSITPLEALNLCGCFRLAARIHDLLDRGNDIITETITTNSSWREKGRQNHTGSPSAATGHNSKKKDNEIRRRHP